MTAPDFITLDVETAADISAKASGLLIALANMGFAVSPAAIPALRENGSVEANALHDAAMDFAAALTKLQDRL